MGWWCLAIFKSRTVLLDYTSRTTVAEQHRVLAPTCGSICESRRSFRSGQLDVRTGDQLRDLHAAEEEGKRLWALLSGAKKVG